MFVDTNYIHVATSVDEDRLFKECDEAIAHIVALMHSLDCDEMISELTGEVVTLDDLKRMRGILSGLPIMMRMYKTE